MPTFDVVVVYVTRSLKTIKVQADTFSEAEKKALEMAKNSITFSTPREHYEVNSIEVSEPAKEKGQ